MDRMATSPPPLNASRDETTAHLNSLDNSWIDDSPLLSLDYEKELITRRKIEEEEKKKREAEDTVVIDDDAVWASQAVEEFIEMLQNDDEAIYEVDDEVWEAKSFQEFRKLNWSCFDYFFDFSFYCLPKGYFEKLGLEEPRHQEWFYHLKNYCIGLETYTYNFERRGIECAEFALDFFNERRKMNGKPTYQFLEVTKCTYGDIKQMPQGKIYFITFAAMENISRRYRDFEANVFVSKSERSWYVRAFRPKPASTILLPNAVPYKSRYGRPLPPWSKYVEFDKKKDKRESVAALKPPRRRAKYVVQHTPPKPQCRSRLAKGIIEPAPNRSRMTKIIEETNPSKPPSEKESSKHPGKK